MKFYRKQTSNIKNIQGRGIILKANSEVVIDTPKSVKVPVGDVNDRPLVPEEGMMRYLVQSAPGDPIDGKLEFYQGGDWKKVRMGTATPIIQQTFQGADDIETIFGPLDNQDPENPLSFASNPTSIFVYIENVYQVPTTNYVLTQDPPGKPAGWYLDFGTPPPTGKDITVMHNFDK
jgi:hypothetical protein